MDSNKFNVFKNTFADDNKGHKEIRTLDDFIKPNIKKD